MKITKQLLAALMICALPVTAYAEFSTYSPGSVVDLARDAANKGKYTYHAPVFALSEVYAMGASWDIDERVVVNGPATISKGGTYGGLIASDTASTGANENGGYARSESQMVTGFAGGNRSSAASASIKYEVTAKLKDGISITDVPDILDLTLPLNVSVSMTTEVSAQGTGSGSASARADAGVSMKIANQTLFQQTMQYSNEYYNGQGHEMLSTSIDISDPGLEMIDIPQAEGYLGASIASYQKKFNFMMAPGNTVAVVTSASTTTFNQGGGYGGADWVENKALSYAQAYADPLLTFDQATFDSYLFSVGRQSYNLADYFDIVYSQGAEPISPVPVPGAVWLLGSGLVGLAGLRHKKK